MTEILAPLSADEETILLLAAQGESMIPIGRWEEPVLALAKRGFLVREDQFNYFITDAGKEALQDREQVQDAEIAGAIRKFIAGDDNA